MAGNIKKPAAPPSLSLWRAAQVVVAEPALVEEFEQAHKLERAGTGARATTATKPTSGSFTDAYEAALHKGRYALDRATPLLNALAEVAGDDGVLQGDAWKKLGPRTGALVLQIAEKSRSATPATGDRAARVLAGLSPGARQALAATTENLVGLEQMPVLARLAAQAATTKPLANHRLFAVQHLFASTFGLFQALQQAGVQAKGSVVFGKSYSTNAEVKQALSTQGFDVYDDYAQKQAVVQDGRIVGLEAPLLSALRSALQDAAGATPPQKLLLLDEGGKLNRMLHDVFPQYASLCTVVEQTTNGVQNMAGITLQAPVVSVAASQLKREVEGPIIGEDVAASTLQMLDAIDARLAQGKTVGIVGAGAIGVATAEAFARRSIRVIVTDLRPEALAQLSAREAARAGPSRASGGSSSLGAWPDGGSIEVRPRAEVLGADIVVGCTGTGAMTLDETALLADGAVLVSAASGDHEFPVVHTQAGRAQGASRDHTAMKDWQGLFDQAADELRAKQAGQPAKPIVTTTTLRAGRATTSSSDGGVTSAKPEGSGGAMTMRFPLGDGTTTKATATLPWDGTRHGNFVFDAGPRRFMLLRGGTPVNLGRDLPPDAIQLTRSMLFAACVQAVDETTPGWVTFSPAVQASIEEHWRSLQR